MSRYKLFLLIGLLSVLLVLGASHAPSAAASGTGLSPCGSSCDLVDPTPLSSDSVASQGIVTEIPPGYRACYPPLSANNSAGLGGYIAFAGTLNKLPKVKVWWAPDYNTPPVKIYSGRIVPDPYGAFQNVLTPSNGYFPYFPGIFQFCVTNPAVNTQSIFLDATEVTY